MMKKVYWMAAGVVVLAGCAHDKPAPPPKAQQPAATAETRSYYTRPLTTPGALLSSLPQVVQTTVLAEAGTAELANVVREVNAGHVCYRLYFTDPATFPPLYVGSDGSVLNADLTVAVAAPHDDSVVKFADLPVSVTRAVLDKAPEEQVTTIKKEYWGDHKIYVVSFKDDIHYPTLYIVSDGTMLIRAQ